MRPRSGVASGVLMVLLGAFVVLRTVRRPDGGTNLVDLILGDGGAAAAINAADAAKANNLLTLPHLTPGPQGPDKPPASQAPPHRTSKTGVRKERLFANPTRPNAYANGGARQLGGAG